MKNNIFHFSYRQLALIAMAICVCIGCAGRKQGKPRYDMMENLTARYNIIYHGRKIIEETTQRNAIGYEMNYQQQLPVLIEPTETTASSNAQLMDSVISKALTLINTKSNSKYLNEAYLLMGKANYLKANYYNATEFFTYTAHAFAEDPEYRQAALTWKARSLMQLGNLTDAAAVLDTVFAEIESARRSVGLAFATQAKYYLLTQDEEAAVTMLLQAMEYTKDKPTRLRWHFLLGQLLQQHGREEEAYGHYSRVVRSNAPYEMAFQAALNRVFLVTNASTTSEDRVRLLQRMLRDGKNSEFKDQIHYQIAEVLYDDNRLDDALIHYGHALQQQSNNQLQTTLTYLRLADHYFDRGTYQTAKLYYDSVGMHLPMDFPNASPIQRKIANLDELITQLQVVSRQDSLLYLAGLRQPQREIVLDSLIHAAYAQMQEDKKNTEARQFQAPSRSPFERDMLNQVVGYTDNRFYFNNPDAMGMGMSEFKRRWGNRALQDNWRFSDMISVSSVQETITPNTENIDAAVEINEVDSATWALQLRESYLTALPDTEEKIIESHHKVHAALLNIGSLYRDELRDHKEAIATYEQLLSRYPDTKDAALIYYNLYLLFNGIDETRANAYKEKLLTAFPDALYSRILRDPSHLAKLDTQKQKLNQEYENVYLLYTQQKFPEVIQIIDGLTQQAYDDQPTWAQLAYLRALAWGRIAGIDTFEQALVQLVNDYPGDSLVRPLANQHLAYIAAHRDTLTTRQYALQHIDESRERFVDEPTMTLWPQLAINRGPERPMQRRNLTVSTAGQSSIGGRTHLGVAGRVSQQQLAKEVQIGAIGENTYRDMELLPDSAVYYFVINVTNERVNLAPSRFGIGQFNRSRYSGRTISHQVKVLNDENQLVYVGPFTNYEDAREYEIQITPLLPDIMKIPGDLYNTFVITENNFGTLSDFNEIDDYYIIYHEQK